MRQKNGSTRVNVVCQEQTKTIGNYAKSTHRVRKNRQSLMVENLDGKTAAACDDADEGCTISRQNHMQCRSISPAPFNLGTF